MDIPDYWNVGRKNTKFIDTEYKGKAKKWLEEVHHHHYNFDEMKRNNELLAYEYALMDYFVEFPQEVKVNDIYPVLYGLAGGTAYMMWGDKNFHDGKSWAGTKNSFGFAFMPFYIGDPVIYVRIANPKKENGFRKEYSFKPMWDPDKDIKRIRDFLKKHYSEFKRIYNNYH